MLTVKCMDAYCKEFPEDDCGFEEPLGDISIEHNGKLFSPPEGETEEKFLDRLKRSKILGENLFYKEWIPFEYDPDCWY